MLKRVLSTLHLRSPLYALLVSGLLWPAFSANAAPAISEAPDAGKTLRESQQMERKLPERQKLDLEVKETNQIPTAGQIGPKILVKGYRISGQSIIPEAELQALLSPYSNKELTHAQMQEVANLVGKHFRKHGFFVAQAYLPAQEIDNGILEITVLIGQYGEIILKNQSSVKDEILRRQLTSLVPGKYVHTSQLERAALLVGDLSGISAKLTLTPGKKLGTTDVIVEAKDEGKKTQGSLSLNNWGNRFTGTNQGNLGVSVNNVLGLADSATLTIGNAGSGQTTGSIDWRVFSWRRQQPGSGLF